MKKIGLVSLVFSTLALMIAALGHAEPLQYLNVNLPQYISQDTSVRVLSDSLKSGNEFIRKCVAVRLGQFDNSSVVPLLINAYENEPVRPFTTDPTNGVRYYALTSIGKAGGIEAESYLTKLANEIFLQQKELDWAKGDAIQITVGVLDGLAEIASQADIDLLLNIFESHGHGMVVRKFAYTAYIRARLKSSNLSHTQEGVNWVLDQLRSIVNSDSTRSSPMNSPNRIKGDALFTNLVELGIDHEEMIRQYRSFLSSEDPVNAELDRILSIVHGWKKRIGKQ